jgi:hypothetical protein
VNAIAILPRCPEDFGGSFGRLSSSLARIAEPTLGAVARALPPTGGVRHGSLRGLSREAWVAVADVVGRQASCKIG